MRWKITLAWTLALLVIPSMAHAVDLCGDRLTPGDSCYLPSAYLDCSTYNFSITSIPDGNIITQNFTVLNDSKYYALINLQEGNYVFQDCQNRVRQLVVTPPEVNIKMLTIIVGTIFAIMFYLFIGNLSARKWGTLLLYGMAIVEFVILSALLYATSAGVDVTGLMNINFFVNLAVMFLAGSVTLWDHVIRKYMDVSGGSEEERPRKW